MGGVGKSELALQYALRDKTAQPRRYPGAICWVNVADQPTVGLDILYFSKSYLGITTPDDETLAQKVKFCWRLWPLEDSLIIFDDVRDYGTIKDVLPPDELRFKVIITTRKQDLSDTIKTLHVEVLDEESALDLLRAYLTPERVSFQLEDAKGLCRDLGYLPLALELVARFLATKKRKWTIAQMRERLKEEGLKQRSMIEISEEATAKRGVEAAFEISWQALTPEAQKAGCYLSLFANNPIPYSLIETPFLAVNRDELEEILEEQLVNLSLLNEQSNNTYQLHTLIRQYFRQKLEALPDSNQAKETYCQTMATVAKKMPETLTKTEIEQYRPVIPHLAIAAQELNQWLKDKDVIEVYGELGRFYQEQGLYQEAEPWFENCLSITRERFGDLHLDVAASLTNLAILFYNQGRYVEAEPLYQEALALYRKLLGDSHSDVAASLGNLGQLYDKQGRYGEAEPLYQEALAMYRKLLGGSHPYVAASLHNLAGLYDKQGRYEEAEPLYQKALAIEKQRLGDSHPDVALSLNNLAHLYRNQERYREAEPLYQEALEICEQVLGDNHPLTQKIRDNLASLGQV